MNDDSYSAGSLALLFGGWAVLSLMDGAYLVAVGLALTGLGFAIRAIDDWSEED